MNTSFELLFWKTNSVEIKGIQNSIVYMIIFIVIIGKGVKYSKTHKAFILRTAISLEKQKSMIH